MVYMGREIIGIEYIGEEREVRQLDIRTNKNFCGVRDIRNDVMKGQDKTYYKVRIGNV